MMGVNGMESRYEWMYKMWCIYIYILNFDELFGIYLVYVRIAISWRLNILMVNRYSKYTVHFKLVWASHYCPATTSKCPCRQVIMSQSTPLQFHPAFFRQTTPRPSKHSGGHWSHLQQKGITRFRRGCSTCLWWDVGLLWWHSFSCAFGAWREWLEMVGDYCW